MLRVHLLGVGFDLFVNLIQLSNQTEVFAFIVILIY